MIVNGSYIEEQHQFKTIEACRAFCRIHPEFTTAVGNAGYFAIHSFGLYAEGKGTNKYYKQSGIVDQLQEAISECKLSYKNIITAGLLGSLTGTKYKMGTECMSHPIIFTYGLGVAAPLLTLWFLLSMLLGITAGIVPWRSMLFFGFLYTLVEFIIPWINSYSVDPIEEPWLIPKWLDDNGISR